MSAARDEGLEIAVVGMSGRFPGARTVEQLWDNLRRGVESITSLTDDELLALGTPPELLRHPAFVKAAALLEDAERFDAAFFSYTPREAQIIDPQQRLFLEVAWEALERAGHDPARFPGSIGVYAGVGASAYGLAILGSPELRGLGSYQRTLGTDKDFLAVRAAYKLGLEGPAVVVQTACSTSLAAVHMASQALLAGECDMALAGGVSVSVPQRGGYLHEDGGILSRDGHCRAFDAEASGTVAGQGVGVVVLRRLADALEDGDDVHAVIRGSAMNNDGAGKAGFTAPSAAGQARVVRMAHVLADVAPDTISYVEAHGTGTPLGDPIEVEALTQAFRAGTPRSGFCGLGSVKTNLGHLDAAAGVAALIKTVLMLRHGEQVPSLHFRRPNPRIDFATSPFRVVTETRPWPVNGAPRRAGVSSFGIGGTNVHVVLEEAPAPSPRASAVTRPQIVVLSARTESALAAASGRLSAHLRAHPEQPLADVAHTLHSGRRAFDHRRAVVASGHEEAAALLTGGDAQQTPVGRAGERAPGVAFLFSGQGAQHVDMARGLYEAEPLFRREVDEACERLRPLLDEDLRRVLYPAPSERPSAAGRIGRTEITQPALFVVELALARLWLSWGVVPEALLGHSVGEYVAACLASVMTRDDALLLVAERGRLMAACPPGAMLAVSLAAERVRALLPAGVALAVENAPDACVVGGAVGDVEAFGSRLAGEGVACARLATSHAFHGPTMDEALPPFAERVARIALQPPRIPIVSNVTGTWLTAVEATDPRYWVRHLRETVRFAAGVGLLLERPRILLEVGPAQTLTALARRRTGGHGTAVALPSLPHPRQPEDDAAFLMKTAARLWTRGVPVQRPAREGEEPRRVALPSYPFEGERYTVPVAPAVRTVPTSALDRNVSVDRWLYVPTWRRAARPSPRGDARARYCLLGAPEAFAGALAARLRAGGSDEVVVVSEGPGFTARDDGRFILDPASRADHERLLAALGSPGWRFVHLWSLGATRADGDAFESLLALVQALGRHGSDAELAVVTDGAEEVTGEEPLRPEHALLQGLSRVVAQEHPALPCRWIDVAAADVTQAAAQLAAELACRAPEEGVAHRGGHRWLPGFEAVESGAALRGVALRERGVYLITGGFGRVGLALAEHLARTVRARLALLGRSPRPDAVERLTRLGAEVLSLRADVADREEMRAALDTVRSRFGALHGVVHAAGVASAGAARLLPQLEAGDAAVPFRAKVTGTRVLGDLLPEGLDFVLLTSSLASLLGGLGFGAYAAANRFLDAFAHAQHRRGRTEWVSVDWDGWRFEGEDAPRGGLGAEPSGLSLSPEEGAAAFERVLTLLPAPQVAVSTADLGARAARWTRSAAPDTVAASERHSRPELQTPYVAPEGRVERRIAAVWADLLGFERVGVHDNFFELGGSSLLAIQLMSRLKAELDAELSVATLFEAPTVRSLAAAVQSRRAASAPGAARPAAGVER